MEKVSIIIPLYNQKNYVTQAIESGLNQTYPNIEIIVVNDGSLDNPFFVLRNYEGRVTILNQKNKGLASARNAGIKRASGDYVQFLDADDLLHKDKIRLQLGFSNLDDNAVSYCEVTQHNQHLQHLYLRYIGEVQDMFSHLYNFWHPYPLPIHSLLFNKEIFTKFGFFDEELYANEDRHYLSRLALSGVIFDYFPFTGGVRRRHSGNMNNNKFHMIENTIKYYQKINNRLSDSFFIEKFGFSGYQMMCANLTYLYASQIASGLSKKELSKVKRLLREKKLRFNTGPIPLGVTRFKSERFFLASCVKRWWKKTDFIRGILPCQDL